MNRAVGCGLVLLAASAGARAQGFAVAGESYFVGAAGGAPARSAAGYLGVSVRDVTEDQVSVLKLKEARGAEIVLVDHDAPAGKAGLREHDVVLQMNGQTIESAEQIKRMLHECAPGTTIVLLVSRDGQQRSVTTQMAVSQEEVERQAWERLAAPDPQAAPVTESASSGASSGPAAPAPPLRGNSFIGTILMSPSYTGAMLEQMSTQLARFFGVSDGAGLLVRSVASNSPAATAGMQAGDVVIRADARPVVTTGDWAKAIKNSHGRSLTIVVMRDKKEQTLTLIPDGKRRSSSEQPGEPQDGALLAHLGMSWMSRL